MLIDEIWALVKVFCKCKSRYYKPDNCVRIRSRLPSKMKYIPLSSNIDKHLDGTIFHLEAFLFSIYYILHVTLYSRHFL